MLRDKKDFEMKPTEGYKFSAGAYSIINAKRSIVVTRFGEKKTVLVQLSDGKCAYLPRVIADNAYDNFDELLERIKKHGSIQLMIESRYSGRYSTNYLDGYFYN